VRALADAVAILGPDHRPRIMLGRLGNYAGFGHLDDLTVRIGDWVHHDDYGLVLDALASSRRAPGVDIEVRVRVHNDHDGWHGMTLVLRNLLDHPDVQGTVVRAVDQTVFDREARWRTLVGESPIGIFELDLDDRCTFVNPAFQRLTGLNAHEALGDGWSSAIATQDVVRVSEQQRDAARTDNASACELRIIGPGGSARWVSMRSVPLREPDGRLTGFLGTIEDITERKGLEERLEHDATHDRLTGLGSRALLVEEMSAALARTRRGGPGVALLFIDLDGFKRVNDSLGHPAGDELLIRVAERIRSAVRTDDVVARLGGDEFVVCCLEVDDEETVTTIASRIVQQVQVPFRIAGKNAVISASVGIAFARGQFESRRPLAGSEELISRADLAMYHAKTTGRSRFVVFDDDMGSRAEEQLAIENALRLAVHRNELVLHYQPIIDLPTGCVVEMEALVRWNRPGHGLVMPDLFIPVAEASRLITAIDSQVVRTACSEAASWPDRSVSVSINLSALDLQYDEMVTAISSALHSSGLAPGRLVIELTETTLMSDDLAVAANLARIESLGVRLAIDDFGTGYSSLSYLRRLPTQTIKIDRSFITPIGDDDAAAAIVGAIITMAHAVGQRVVAEGVETAGQAARLKLLGCDSAQGYLYARPQPAEIAWELVNTPRRQSADRA
jgi:diguanylate cyclase (GGDEF)-like protein/PAS domain S-box-containing protein